MIYFAVYYDAGLNPTRSPVGYATVEDATWDIRINLGKFNGFRSAEVVDEFDKVVYRLKRQEFTDLKKIGDASAKKRLQDQAEEVLDSIKLEE